MALLKLSTIVAVAVAVLGSLIIAAPAEAANAFEFDHAVSSSDDPCGDIIVGPFPPACGYFQPFGDHFFIRDTTADKHSAAIYWHNYLPSAPNTLYRWGSCVNSMGSAGGGMGQCNKNFQEGSRIDWKVCLYDSGTTPSDVNNYFHCSSVVTSYA
jgi:hypothetical protein